MSTFAPSIIPHMVPSEQPRPLSAPAAQTALLRTDDNDRPDSPLGQALAELTGLDQWVVWRRVMKTVKGRRRVDKVPYCARTGATASHSDPATWATFSEACAVAHRYDGIGFVFSEHDPFSGVDIDDCRDPATGVIHPEALRIIRALDSYTEVSPSGRGVKIFLRGCVSASIGHSQYPGAPFFVEIYARQRYFTVTGQHLEGTPRQVNEAQAALDTLYTTMRPPAPADSPQATTTHRAPLGTTGVGRLRADDARVRFNQAHSLDSLLTQYGAVRTRDGYSCPFCEHTHETTLYISKHGRLFSFSPRCTLHTTHGWDAFGLFVKVEHENDVVAALKAINPPVPHTQELPSSHPAEAQPDTPSDAKRAAEAARKRQARRTAADELRAEVEARMAADDTLTGADRAVLETLLTIAGKRGWCRPSKERIAEESGYSLGSVKRSLMRLEGRYFTSEGDGGGPNCTAIRTFLRGSSAGHDPRDHKTHKEELVSGGGTPAPAVGPSPTAARTRRPVGMTPGAADAPPLTSSLRSDAPVDMDTHPAPRALVSEVRALARAVGGLALLVEYDVLSTNELLAAKAELRGRLPISQAAHNPAPAHQRKNAIPATRKQPAPARPDRNIPLPIEDEDDSVPWVPPAPAADCNAPGSWRSFGLSPKERWTISPAGRAYYASTMRVIELPAEIDVADLSEQQLALDGPAARTALVTGAGQGTDATTPANDERPRGRIIPLAPYLSSRFTTIAAQEGVGGCNSDIYGEGAYGIQLLEDTERSPPWTSTRKRAA